MQKNLKNRNHVWAIYVYDVIVVLAFVWLAISFDKWWLSLLGLFFLLTPSYKTSYYRICDRCGRRSPMSESYNGAIGDAIEAGWLHRSKNRISGEGGFEDFCPECRREMSSNS